MSRVWDILPPRKKPTKHERKEAKKRSKGLTLFLSLIFIIIVAFIYFGANQNISVKTPPVAGSPQNIVPTPTPTEAISSGPLKDKTNLTIKLLNGSGQAEELSTTYKLLEDAGFKAQQTENTLNLYDQTIIYYQPSQEKYALQIAEILKKYQAKVQKFSQEAPYDLIVVIGPR